MDKLHHTFGKNTVIYSVLRLVTHQGICIFPAETLLMLMMLNQKFSSTPVSIFNDIFSRGFEAINFTVTIFDHLRSHMSPGDARKEVGGMWHVSV